MAALVAWGLPIGAPSSRRFAAGRVDDSPWVSKLLVLGGQAGHVADGLGSPQFTLSGCVGLAPWSDQDAASPRAGKINNMHGASYRVIIEWLY